MKETGTVVAIAPVEGDVAGFVQVAVLFEDGRIERANLRPDLVPPGLNVNDRVLLTRAALYRRWRIEIATP